MILGIDPGTRKAGYALLDDAGAVVLQGIEETHTLLERVRALASEQRIDAIALGKGTHASVLAAALEAIGLPLELVDERETTLRARKLYFADHPPRGWRRLIPLGMQLPPRPIDDYAAVLIARRYLAQAAPSTAPE